MTFETLAIQTFQEPRVRITASIRTAVFDLELKIFRLHQLGIPQDRIAKRLGVIQQRISRHLLKMPGLAKRVNTDLSKGFTGPAGGAHPVFFLRTR
jgi:hypothetical protein